MIKLKGLDENTYYKDEETGEIYSGALLMHAGINLTPNLNGTLYIDTNEDGASIMKYFTAVK